MPRVSVILPNFNHGDFLVKRIESILNQDFQDFELIILDDCSTDNSRDIIETYRSSSKVTQVVLNERNSGNTFIQWDKGLSLAQGELIWIAESDDSCEPNFLSELIAPYAEDPQLVIAYCQSLFVTESGRIINKTIASQLSLHVEGKQFLSRYLIRDNSIANVSMALLRKKAMLQVTADYKKFKYCGDWFLYANMALLGNVFISGKYLNYYLRHENSVTSKATSAGLDFLEGNQVFHFIKSKVTIENSDLLPALDRNIGRFIELENSINREVQQPVLDSLMKLDPLMPSRFRKKCGCITCENCWRVLKAVYSATVHKATTG